VHFIGFIRLSGSRGENFVSKPSGHATTLLFKTAESTEYAEQLVSLSRQLTAARNQPMIGMAKRSDLAKRITSVLDTTRVRGRASLAAAAFAVFVGFTVVIAVGPLRAVAQVAAAPPSVEKQSVQVAATPPPVEKETAQANARVDDDDDTDVDDDSPAGNPLDVQLYNAAEHNALEKARVLIQQGANVNAGI
jgi:hypothetical protein